MEKQLDGYKEEQGKTKEEVVVNMDRECAQAMQNLIDECTT